VSHLELRPGFGQAIWAYAVLTSSFHDLSLVGGTFGFTGLGNFLNRFDNIHLTSTGPHGRVGLDLSGGVSGITSVRNLTFTAWAFGIVQDSGSSTFDSLYFHGDKQVIPIVLRHGSYVVTSTSFSIEDADPGPYFANLLLVDNPNVAIVGGNSSGSSVWTGVRLTAARPSPSPRHTPAHPRATEIIRIVAPTANRILILNGYTDQPGVPWTTCARDVTVLSWRDFLCRRLHAPPSRPAPRRTASLAPAPALPERYRAIGEGVGWKSGPSHWNLNVANRNRMRARRKQQRRVRRERAGEAVVERLPNAARSIAGSPLHPGTNCHSVPPNTDARGRAVVYLEAIRRCGPVGDVKGDLGRGVQSTVASAKWRARVCSQPPVKKPPGPSCAGADPVPSNTRYRDGDGVRGRPNQSAGHYQPNDLA
jgi:hypothetical protein